MKVLVCDDKDERGLDVADSVRAAGQADVSQLTGDHLQKELTKLFDRVKQTQGDFTGYVHERSRFDEADVLLLDNNLTLLKSDGPPMTAESIVGYIRAFTQAGYIVSLNMNPDVDFDLRYLVGDFSTRADLAINGDHVANKYLWTGNTRDADHDFCPSYWPRLGDVAQYRKRQINFVLEQFEASILDALGFGHDSIQMLSRHSRGALSPQASAESEEGRGIGQPLREITFRDFFLTKNRALPLREERERLADAFESNDLVRNAVARIVAADIDLWLRRDVIGPQEPLVDVPHLTTRLPFLLGERANDPQAWNDVLGTKTPPFGWNELLYQDVIAPALFLHNHTWAQSPCFWWSTLSNDDRVDDRLRASQNEDWADVVFCEDTSRFQSRLSDETYRGPVEFVTEFEGIWNRRHITKLEDIRYAPLTRLAL